MRKRSTITREARRARKANLICDEIFSYGSDILDSDLYFETDNFVQHGKTSTLDHQISVAIISIRIAKVLHIRKCDYYALVRSALLHDFYLYDWHDKSSRKKNKGLLGHGSGHGSLAVINAASEFSLNPKEANIIRNHMFPLTRPPKYREGAIVIIADKIAALKETFSSKAAFSRAIDEIKYRTKR